MDFPVWKIKTISNAIGKHSPKARPAEFFTLEEKIIIDAGILDEVGAHCILRDAIGQGREAEPSCYAAYDLIHRSF
ncbi:MAG TPA: hypothetical protein GX528_02170 [Firmicutes bacterium]|nr:hypothetical protein [Bacillota bacterium]